MRAPSLGKIALALLCGACFFMAPAARAESFSFAQYGDIHLIDAGTTTTALLTRLVDFVNKDLAQKAGGAVDFIVDTGDAYQGGEPQAVLGAYRAALDRMATPWQALRGNHDIAPGLGVADWTRVMGREAHFSFTHKGVAFIGFDTAVNEPTWQRPSASAETMAWLKAESAKLPEGAPVVLITHVPLGSKMGLPAVYPLVNRKQVLGLFGKQKVLAVISGHFHGAKESVENGTLFTTTPTFSPNRENHDKTKGGAVRIFTIRDGAITTRLVGFSGRRE